jgi:hypothetical protein
VARGDGRAAEEAMARIVREVRGALGERQALKP